MSDRVSLDMLRKNQSPPEDSRRRLVQRVVSSSYFNKSARLSEMFLYLCNRVLDESANDIHELEVGREVFGRPAHYDTTADNIVRVHASMLRKRIDQYFSGEGSDEPVVIDIPKGNYAPVFRPRTVAGIAEASAPSPQLVSPAPSEAGSNLPRERNWKKWLPIAFAVFFICSTAFLLFLNRASVRRGRDLAVPPIVRQFWSQIFLPGKPTAVVLDDAAVGVYQEITGQQIALSQYFDRSYLRIASPGDVPSKPLDSMLTGTLLLRRQSSYENVALLPKLANIAGEMQSSVNLRFARDFSFREVKGGNVILLGNSHSNPWIQPFESHLTLRWNWDPSTGAYYPIDSTASNPEKYRKATDPTIPPKSYTSIAFLPNLGGNGNVLIISGTGGTATNAALAFLSDDRDLQQLQSMFPEHSGQGFPYFEILLKVENRNSLRRGVTIVISRHPHA